MITTDCPITTQKELADAIHNNKIIVGIQILAYTGDLLTVTKIDGDFVTLSYKGKTFETRIFSLRYLMKKG